VLADAVEGARPDATLAQLLAHDPLAQRPSGIDGDSDWAILYTSGSSGRPKGVVLPAGAFTNGGMGYADRFGAAREDNYLLATPMAHAVGGLTAQCMAIYAGCRLSIVDRFSPTRFWGQVLDYETTFTILFPAHLNLLLETAAGAPAAGTTPLRLVITHAWIEAFRERFGSELALCWGMTETGAGSTGTLPGYRGERGDGYVGPGMDRVELAILDAAGARVPTGEPGEICVRTGKMMRGYLDDPEATAASLIDGWVHSGDIGTLDAEGHLTYGGRIKNMIKRSGENISPEEIEATLAAHDAVAECLVIGVPDPIRTEEVAAIVVVRAGASTDGPELAGFAGERLARWKLPRYVLVREQPLPRLGGGKIDRRRAIAELELAAAWDRQAATPRR
jgi:acyl-CoA synthetase (AMP-forming)/AMP-acid ligase II